MNYESNITQAEAARLILEASSAVVITHAKPDGDAFGSVVALVAALRQLGRSATGLFVPPVPASFQTLRGQDLCQQYRQNSPLPDAELVILADTGAWAQLGPVRDVLQPRLPHTLILDHHLSGDVAAAWRFIDGRAAATCEIVARVLETMQLEAPRGCDFFSPAAAEALFVGIASDTGWFRFSNTTAYTHELAARLMKTGVDHTEIYRQTEQMERPEKLALMTRALDSMQLLAGGRAAIMVLRDADFAQTGAVLEETERFVDVPQAVGSVELVALITETPNGTPGNDAPASPASTGSGKPGHRPLIRVSFRSKPGPQAVDVAKLAGRWGGGGHARAAGAKITAPLDDVICEVRRVLEAQF